MNKIESLTPKQEQQLLEFRDKWLKIGTNIEPANRQLAEQTISEMYRLVVPGQQFKFIWCDSPLTSLLALYLIEKGASLRASLWEALGEALGDSLWDSLWASLGASLGEALGDSLGDSLWDSLRDSLRASLRASLGDSLRASLGDSLGEALGDSLGASLWEALGDSLWDSHEGQQEAYWIAFYKFPEEYLGVEYVQEKSEQLELWARLAKSCCWWWPYRNYCIISDRPEVCNLDDRGVIHGETGPAVRFRDGWSVYAYHGVRVSEKVITDIYSYKPQDILNESNTEIRRVMIEKYGQEKFMFDANPMVKDVGSHGTLYELPLEEDEPIVMVKVKDNSTDREYFLRVPPEIETADNAVAWTFSLSSKDYQPIVET